jgi:hypothetical protein
LGSATFLDCRGEKVVVSHPRGTGVLAWAYEALRRIVRVHEVIEEQLPGSNESHVAVDVPDCGAAIYVIILYSQLV